MGLGDFWLQFSNGKKLDLNNPKSGLHKKDIDKKFSSLFDMLDGDHNNILTAEEVELFYILTSASAGSDKKLSKAEEKDLLKLLGVDIQGENILSEFVQSFDKIKESKEGHFEDGTKIVRTVYENGEIETLILYPDGGLKTREIKTPKEDSPSNSKIKKYVVKKEYSERAKKDLQTQSLDWVKEHTAENLKIIKDYQQKEKGFLEKSTETIIDLFGKTLQEVQADLIDQNYYAGKTDVTIYNKKLGGSFSPKKFEKFQQTDSKYMNARFWKGQTEELQKGLKQLKNSIQKDKLRRQGINVPVTEKSTQEIFAEIFNKYCAGNRELAQQMITAIAGDIKNVKDLTPEKMLEVANKLDNASKQMLKENLKGERYEELEKRFQNEYKSLYGKEDYTDFIQQRIGSIEGWASMEKIAIVMITQILLGILTGGGSAAAEGAAGAALATGGKTASKGLLGKVMASQAIKKLVAKHGEAKVMNWIQKTLKFLMLTGTVAEDVGIGFINAATTEQGITWEKSKELLKQGASSAKYIFFGGYCSGPIASFISSKIKTSAAVARAFKGGTKVTKGAITTTTIPADKFLKSMQKATEETTWKNFWKVDPVKLAAGTASVGTEVGAFALLDLATEDISIKDAISGSADMQLKLKIISRLFETLLGGLAHRISSGGAKAMPKLDAEIEKALQDKALKGMTMVEYESPNGTLYSIEAGGKTLFSAKEPNMLFISLTSYVASNINFDAIREVFEDELNDTKTDKTTKDKTEVNEGGNKIEQVKNIQLEDISIDNKINEGNDAYVYSTNVDDCVIRIKKGATFNPKELKWMKNPNGLILASNSDGSVRLMKFVKGKPLYGENWNINEAVSKEVFNNTLQTILELPDETFAEYIRNIIQIRKNGYDIDTINPNNLLLDGQHVNIVDIEKRSVKPEITIKDFESLLNIKQPKMLHNMSSIEIEAFARQIKSFYDRMIQIAKKEGYNLEMPAIDHNKLQQIVVYLYHADWEMLEEMDFNVPTQKPQKTQTSVIPEVPKTETPKSAKNTNTESKNNETTNNVKPKSTAKLSYTKVGNKIFEIKPEDVKNNPEKIKEIQASIDELRKSKPQKAEELQIVLDMFTKEIKDVDVTNKHYEAVVNFLIAHYASKENYITQQIQRIGLDKLGRFIHRLKGETSTRDKIENYIKNSIEKGKNKTLLDAYQDVRDAYACRTIFKRGNFAKHPDVVKIINEAKKLKLEGKSEQAKNKLHEAEMKAAELQSEQVLNTIKEAIDAAKKGNSDLTAIRISNYTSENGIPILTPKQMAELKQYLADNFGIDVTFVRPANEIAPDAKQNIDVSTKQQPSGYTALQINFITKSGEVIEWQFRGELVDIFAEAEHLPYDLRTGKRPWAQYPELKDLYEPIAKLLDKDTMPEEVYNNINKYFVDYYAHLRRLELGFESTEPKLSDYEVYTDKNGIKHRYHFDERLNAKNLITLHEVAEDVKQKIISKENSVNVYRQLIEKNK